MAATSSSETSIPEDELLVTEELQKLQVYNFHRKGSLQEGLVVQIPIGTQNLLFSVDKNWKSTIKNFKEALQRFPIESKKNESIKKIRFKLESAIILFMVDNSNWINGNDLKQASKGYTVSEPDTESTTDIDESKEPQSYLEITIDKIDECKAGTKVVIEGLITTRTNKIFRIAEIYKYICKHCTRTITYPNKQLLEEAKPLKICPNPDCKSEAGFDTDHKMLRALNLEVEALGNIETAEMSSIRVMVFEDDTKEAQWGSQTTIWGTVVDLLDSKTGVYNPIIKADKAEYHHQRAIEITPKFIAHLKKLAKRKDYTKFMISQFAPDIIGLENHKLAVMLAIVGGVDVYYTSDKNEIILLRRGKMNLIMIGPTSEAKSMMLKYACATRPNSIYIHSEKATSGSVTAMTLMLDGKLAVHWGAALLAKKGILGMNEYDKWSIENRNSLLEPMENNRVIVYTYGKKLDYITEVSVFATSNPENDVWRKPDEIKKEELPFRDIELSRFDVILIFRDENTEESDVLYADQRGEQFKEVDLTPYTEKIDFLRQAFAYMKSLHPQINDASLTILKREWVRLRNEYRKTGFPLNKKSFETLRRYSEASAKFNTHEDFVTESDAYEAVQIFEFLHQNFNVTNMQEDKPIMLLYDETIKKIKHYIGSKSAIPLLIWMEGLCKKKFPELRTRIGPTFTPGASRLVRDLCWKIVHTKGVKTIHSTKAEPTKVYWEEPRNDET